MSRIQSTNSYEDSYFVTFTVVKWIDLFTRKEIRQIIIDSLKYCQAEKGLLIYGYVIMSNHMHLIIGTKGKCRICDINRDFKKFTAKKIYDFIKHSHESRKSWILPILRLQGKNNPNNKYIQVWIQDSHPVIIETQSFFWEKLQYIHNNPVAAEIVYRPEDYVYSSATSYAGLICEALIDVIVVE